MSDEKRLNITVNGFVLHRLKALSDATGKPVGSYARMWLETHVESKEFEDLLYEALEYSKRLGAEKEDAEPSSE